MPDLLYEIGVEELPASYIQPALNHLELAILHELKRTGLVGEQPDAIHATGTPRRLVLAVEGACPRQPDVEQDVTGPPAKVAFDAEGNPTKAAIGFAQSQGVDLSDVRQEETPRGVYCVVRKKVEGRPAVELLAEILPDITPNIPFPKSMLWPGTDKPFARPVRWLVALLDADLIEFELFGIRTGRRTEGHPILSPGWLDLGSADFETYKTKLRQRCVVVDGAERRAAIWKRLGGWPPGSGAACPDVADELVKEVANLVQDPSVSLCGFDEEFLALPASVIKAAMIEHQRYFPMETDGKLTPHFIVVSDRGAEPDDLIRIGNEEVLRARLSDAQFFYEQDGKSRLEDRVGDLTGVAFLKGLGTYAEKVERLESLSRDTAEALGMDEGIASHAARAAHLCKADLLTAMVGEFPKLQGEVGRIYALRDGEPGPVATAIYEHYLPRSGDGELPSTPAGCALSLAEKMDNLTSCFALGLSPTGSADPYALRRQAQGAVRTIQESGRHLSISALAEKALALLPAPYSGGKTAVASLMDFIRDRVFQMALDRGAPHDLIRAALAAGIDDVIDFRLRLDALMGLCKEEGWQDLVTAVERTSNITRDAAGDGEVDPALFTEPLEKDLWSLVEQHGDEIERLEQERRYEEASRKYADVFSKPLHQFFEEVFVNVDDEQVRANRLQLLRRINRLYTARIADLSEIVTGVHK